MKQTITPERLLGEYIGTLRGICAWDIPEQLREKLERRAKELESLDVDGLKISGYLEEFNNSMKNPIKLTFPIYNKESGEDVFDITTMD